jgi:hypothetical protein
LREYSPAACFQVVGVRRLLFHILSTRIMELFQERRNRIDSNESISIPFPGDATLRWHPGMGLGISILGNHVVTGAQPSSSHTY